MVDFQVLGVIYEGFSFEGFVLELSAGWESIFSFVQKDESVALSRNCHEAMRCQASTVSYFRLSGFVAALMIVYLIMQEETLHESSLEPHL